MDVRQTNKEAWNRLVENENVWTKPVSPGVIAQARAGTFSILLTPSKPVPASWFPKLMGVKVLCLASGGGQQGPILSAAGADVTVFDNSPLQLGQDTLVARREGLSLKTVEGDMRDLSAFSSETFDFIFHPCSNGFCEDIRPVWKECFRVLKKNGTMISGVSNPHLFLFDPILEKQNVLQLRFSAPYSDLTSVTPEQRQEYFPDQPLSFGHTLDDQIGAQLEAGFHLIGFYEDDWGGKEIFDNYFKGFFAMRALKPS